MSGTRNSRKRWQWLTWGLGLCCCCLGGLERLSAAEEQAAPAAERSTAESADESSEPEYKFVYKFQSNQFVHFDVWSSTTIHTQLAEAKETVHNESRARQHYRVVAVDDAGNGILESKIDRVRLTARFGENPPIIFDSTHPESECPRQFRSVMRTVGKPLARMKFSPQGKLLSVTTLIEGLGGQVDDDGQKALQNFLVPVPPEPLALGESWKDIIEIQASVPGSKTLKQPIKLRRRFTLESVEDGIATIRLKTAILTPVHDPQVRAELIQRAPKGTIQFDLNRGMIISRTTQIEDSVVGYAGENSAMHAESQTRETLLTDEELADPDSFLSEDSKE